MAESSYVKNCQVHVGVNPTSIDSPSICATIGSDAGIPPGGSKKFDCTPWLVGQYVTIRKTVQYEPITTCEVVVLGNDFSSSSAGN